ncbi:tRNA uridine-5-carboxymethylaminomethyl(34) synthesis GTPase MnmE [Rubrivirga marina]|uniref:tRNA modification GTPase MnmE n=1 Tax=Rubrivirga marina TaxID=1196024 RepID=A0A271IZ16_9BACT|nr:tRNA uridine-5-carboxymethylaminomethyl(34) synthesis GTPase MnmE [Rubrivirga marina]PAP76054.1 tRNA uridine-5-carboxymethylaminomethyl(34) synthesis GTPase MnmE [Rubrivirga marina]
MPPDARSTIAALATARGTAALAVVRVSGPEAVPVVASRFSNEGLAEAEGRTVWVGWLRDGDGRRIDQVVSVVWRGPHSSTGEDVVEVTCHGGDTVAQAVLRALYDAGARPAAPGEFTQRAFLHGKLDLAQAEAVADLIHAESRLGHRTAVAALRGRVSDAVGAVRQSLVQTAALVELELDFGEEDVEFADRDDLRDLLTGADRLLEELVGSARLGALARDGVRVVLGGRPNAGKSTLLNALVGEDRAIVSPTPGTTRDAVEAEAEIGGLRFRFVDTAGLRETADAIEAEGTRRARAAIDTSDVLVYVVDAAVGLDGEERSFLDDLAVRRPDLPVICIQNKADLVTDPARLDAEAEGGTTALVVSAQDAMTNPAALDGLRRSLLHAVRAEGLDAAEGGLVAVNERHRAHLEAAREAVGRARRTLAAGSGGDTLALDLRAALHELGLVTGAVTTEHVLDAVFSQFCIGK